MTAGERNFYRAIEPEMDCYGPDALLVAVHAVIDEWQARKTEPGSREWTRYQAALDHLTKAHDYIRLTIKQP